MAVNNDEHVSTNIVPFVNRRRSERERHPITNPLEGETVVARRIANLCSALHQQVRLPAGNCFVIQLTDRDAESNAEALTDWVHRNYAEVAHQHPRRQLEVLRSLLRDTLTG